VPGGPEAFSTQLLSQKLDRISIVSVTGFNVGELRLFGSERSAGKKIDTKWGQVGDGFFFISVQGVCGIFLLINLQYEVV
jgi:hypothetical protein